MSKNDNKKEYSPSASLSLEWERLKFLIPKPINDERMVDNIEKDLFRLIDGKKTCNEIIENQSFFSKDGAVLIILKLEKDGIIACIEPVERLKDVKFELSDVKKEYEFTLLEKMKLSGKLKVMLEELDDITKENITLKLDLDELNEKISIAGNNEGMLSKKYKEVSSSTDRLVDVKTEMLKRKVDIDKTVVMLKEEVLFINDEKWSTMKSIRELESRIDEILETKESVVPKMSVYRSVVREASKTLRDAKARADMALKGIY